VVTVKQRLLRKVPEVTLYFWVIKLLTTAMGESVSDYLVGRYNPYAVVVSGFIAFVLAIAWQFKVRRYIPAVYWLTVAMVAVFGTMAADVMHVALGIPYLVSTMVFVVALAVIFALWWHAERTLSIHSIDSRRREVFYWATVLATFALGTAAGDMMAYTAGLGFLSAGLAFAALFALPAIAYRWFGLNEVAAFWAAYIVTRPLGASFADWMGKPVSVGGLGWGDGPVSGVLAAAIVLLVAYVTWRSVDAPRTASSGSSER
jgi:uncharacterized membrane-anchored protein